MKEKYLDLVSVNIGGDSYLSTVEDFLVRRRPDVILLQEVFEDTFLNLGSRLQAEGTFAPLMRFGRRRWGLTILSKYPITNSGLFFYAGEGESTPQVDYIFATPHYRTKQVQVIPGVSDHCALTARIFKNQ